eukprot:659980-Rhodomonas_salina.1
MFDFQKFLPDVRFLCYRCSGPSGAMCGGVGHARTPSNLLQREDIPLLTCFGNSGAKPYGITFPIWRGPVQTSPIFRTTSNRLDGNFVPGATTVQIKSRTRPGTRSRARALWSASELRKGKGKGRQTLAGEREVGDRAAVCEGRHGE